MVSLFIVIRPRCPSSIGLSSVYGYSDTEEQETGVQVYEAGHYQDYIRQLLAEGTATRPKSTKKSLALHLKCHSTFISHVLAEKAHFSLEQAVRFSDYYGLSSEETDFYLDLVNRDRAGDHATRDVYESRLGRAREQWMSISGRLKETDRLSDDEAADYFENWLLQTVHLACLLPDCSDALAIAERLGMAPERIAVAIRLLEEMGLVTRVDGGYQLVNRRLHLDKNSPTFKRYHASWRAKILHDVSTRSRLDGIHYTSLVTVSRAKVDEIRKLILDHIESTRSEFVDSTPEELYLYSLDFYQVSESGEPEAD